MNLAGIDWESGERFLSLRRALGVTSFGLDGEAFSAWSESEGRPPQEVPLPDDLPPSS